MTYEDGKRVRTAKEVADARIEAVNTTRGKSASERNEALAHARRRTDEPKGQDS